MHIDDKKLLELDEGHYIIRVKTPWINKEQSEFLITTYSDEEVMLDFLPKVNYKDYLEKFYTSIGNGCADKYDMGKGCEFVSGWGGNRFWLYMSNNSSDKTWDLEIVFKKMDNMRVAKSYQLDNMTLKMLIPPKTQKIAFLKRTSKEKTDIDWAFKNNWV